MYNNDAVLVEKPSYTLSKKKQLFLATLICALGAMFYMYEFILQVSTAVMTNELMSDLHLNAAELGAMTAFYYYAYTPMQLPAGLLYDRFGPRLLLTLAVSVCALGAFLFAATSNVWMASTGRFLMGIGSAFSFIGALLLVSRWFPPHYFALLAGLVQLMSSLGAIAGQVSLASAIHHWGWRPTLHGLAWMGTLLGLLMWLIVRNSPTTISPNLNTPPASNLNELQRLKKVCKNKQTWLIALYSFTVWGPITAFAALWGIPFLMVKYGITLESASKASAMIWLGVGLGSPFLGWLSDKVRARNLPLSSSAFLGIVSLLLVIYAPHLSLVSLYILLFLFGLSASGQALSFGVVKDHNSTTTVGTAIGFNNMAVVAGGALFQPLIGILLYYYWNGALQAGKPFYSALDYQKSFILLPICFILAFIVSQFLLQETHCQPISAEDRPS